MAALLIGALALLLSLGSLGVWSKDSLVAFTSVNTAGVSPAQYLDLSKSDPAKRRDTFHGRGMRAMVIPTTIGACGS